MGHRFCAKTNPYSFADFGIDFNLGQILSIELLSVIYRTFKLISLQWVLNFCEILHV